MQIIIREAQSNDYFSIGELMKNELGYQQINIEKLYSRMDKMKLDDRYFTVVAEVKEKIVGFIGVFKGIAFNDESEYIQIIALAILKEHQNKGIGSLLLKYVEDYAIRNDVRSFSVNSGLHRKEAHTFYEHNGYIKKSYGFIKDI